MGMLMCAGHSRTAEVAAASPPRNQAATSGPTTEGVEAVSESTVASSSTDCAPATRPRSTANSPITRATMNIESTELHSACPA